MEAAVKSPLEMFYQWEQTTPNKVFLRQPTQLVWAEFTWAQIGDQVMYKVKHSGKDGIAYAII